MMSRALATLVFAKMIEEKPTHRNLRIPPRECRFQFPIPGLLPGCRQHTQNRCISLKAACGFSKKWTDEILYLAGLSIPSKYSIATAHIRAVRIGFPFDPTNERRWFSGSLNSFTGNFSLKTCVHHRRTLYVNGFARRVRLRANTIGTKAR